MSLAGRWMPGCWALVLSVGLLGPALLPGFVLTYDMVWVPDLALRPDFLGLGSGLPRAVPSDAVVALLDEVVPGMLLQKVVLLGALVGAGTGAAALVADLPVLARCAAVSVYLWSPLVVERLLIGHWPLLLTLGVLPWTILALRRRRAGESGRGWWLLVVAGSLSPSGGVLMAVVVAVFAGAGRSRWCRIEPAAVLAAVNAPWLVAGLLHAAAARSDPRGAAVFALSDEGLLPGPLAALGLGGIWNAQTVPASRLGVLAVAALVVLVGLVGAGVVRRRQIDDAGRLAIVWGVGFLCASLTWLVPQTLGQLAAAVPGGGVMRDGGRFLILCAPGVAVLVGHGVAVASGTLAVPLQRLVVAGCLALAPVALMPDAAWGVSGRVSAVAYPAAYGTARDVVADRGDVLVLPFSSYRRPDWNGSRPLLDPVGRYLRPDYVANDDLVIGGEVLPGEDPRANAVGSALAGPDPAEALGALGIRTVVVDTTAPGSVPDVRGETLLRGELTVIGLPAGSARVVPRSWLLALTMSWLAFGVVLITGAAGALRQGVSRMRVRRSAA